MKCANCREEGPPAYTLRAHVKRPRNGADRARSDGGEAAVELQFCSIECLKTWT